MKRLAALMALVLIAALLCPVCALAEGGMVDVRIDVSYETGMARAMLDMINDFRCGSNAWQWNSDNRTKTVVTGLKPLKYDEGLESIAMRRAAELASYYSQTRPNGKDPFSFGQKGNLGENIACGYNAYTTTKDMFEGWLEDGVNTYMADSVDGFQEKICDILEGRLPDLTEAGYDVARQREIHKVGRELVDVYARVLGAEADGQKKTN